MTLVSRSTSDQVGRGHSQWRRGQMVGCGAAPDRLLIKVLTRGDVVLSPKVGKGPLAMRLILHPCSHV